MKGHKSSYDDPKPEIYTSFSGGLAFDYPEELIDALDRFQGDKLEFILKNLESEAEKVLRAAGYDPALNELQWLDGYEMGVQLASAKQVLLSAYAIRDLVDRNESALVALEMMLLITSAIKAEVSGCLYDGLDRMKSRSTGGKHSNKLLGIELAINEILDGGDLTVDEIWWQFEDDLYEPLEISGPDVFFKEGRLYQRWVNTSGVTKEGSISRSTFKDYVSRVRKERKIKAE